ncbi:glycosyltransferase family 4 protein [Synechococcus sp. CS-1324]|uniref:glycosyltransferase n=1 Tax=Synechococcus sp. CS-1324 TaxID=2847980 RepID=UPI000DB5FD41|nr:glycosyltransferase family 4 protein [Synechococcus sp. CS-1324]MCT0231083.1 glycosyltransferase family 4 protein [Synechococcus sp. CS-1324]PZV05445.1 MAG: hypothetical protein DCF23_03150 [Cyanobium sp.]
MTDDQTVVPFQTSQNANGRLQKVILFATIVPLDTSSGGTIVCRDHLRSIVGAHGTETHVFAPPGITPGGAEDFARSVGAVFHPLVFQPPRGGLLSMPNPLAQSFSMERDAALYWRVDLSFRDLLTEIRPDVIFLDYLFSALFLPSAFHCGARVVMITQNREKEFYSDQRKLGLMPAKAVDSALAEWRLGRFENEVLASADHIVVLSSHDIPSDSLQAARTTVIEPMLDEHALKWRHEGLSNVFFVGNVNHYPNFSAVHWLCESFAPALAACAPEARITIIGAEPDDAPETWKQPNVDLLGRSTADEVLRQFTGCGLFIAPIENSFGSKIKILEALAYATPLLATAEALTGVPGSNGIPLFTLDDPQTAAELAAGLLRSPGKLGELSRLMDDIRNGNLARSLAAWPALIEQVCSRPVMPRRSPWRSFLRPRRSPAGRQEVDVEIGTNSSVWIHSAGLGPVEQFRGLPLRWTAESAALTVAIDPDRPPRWLRVRTWGITPARGTHLRVFVNESEVLSGKVRSRLFDRVARLSPLRGHRELTLRFESPGFQIPGDDRVLGVALESVRLGRSLDMYLLAPWFLPAFKASKRLFSRTLPS